jgi:exodeoxyribonuclease V beta subunit
MGVEKPTPNKKGEVVGEPGGFSEVLKDVDLDPSLIFQKLTSEIKEYVLPLVPLGVDNDLAKPIPSPLFVPQLGQIPQRLALAYGVTSYSGLSKGKHDAPPSGSGFEDPEESAEAVSLLIPDNLKGNLLGNLLHKLMELLDFKLAVKNRIYLKDLVARLLGGSGLVSDMDPEFEKTVNQLTDSTLIWLKQSFQSHDGKAFSLSDLDFNTQLAEVRFCFAASIDNKTFPQLDDAFAKEFTEAQKSDLAKLGLSWDRNNPLDGLVTGSVDFIFAQDGRYYIIDWKSNFIGESSADYLPERISKSIAKERYHLQFSLYTVALDAHLRQCLGDKWNYERDFGGVYYVYLRGFGTHPDAKNGAFFHRPSEQFIQNLRSILQPNSSIP